MTKEQNEAIAEFIAECKADGIKAEPALMVELSGFLSSLSRLHRSQELRGMSSNKQALELLIKQHS